MLLNIRERLLALQVLPKESDFLTQRIVRDLRTKIGLSEADFKTYEIVTLPTGGIQWNIGKDKGVEIEIGPKSKELIVNGLKELDKQKKVTEDYLSLFEKFIEVDQLKVIDPEIK